MGYDSIKNGKKWKLDSKGNWHFKGYATGSELNHWYRTNRVNWAREQYKRKKRARRYKKRARSQAGRQATSLYEANLKKQYKGYY